MSQKNDSKIKLSPSSKLLLQRRLRKFRAQRRLVQLMNTRFQAMVCPTKSIKWTIARRNKCTSSIIQILSFLHQAVRMEVRDNLGRSFQRIIKNAISKARSRLKTSKLVVKLTCAMLSITKRRVIVDLVQFLLTRYLITK